MTTPRYVGPIRRRQYGRSGHGYIDANGLRVPGVTTILNGGLPKPALVGWAAKTIAEYVADRLDQNDEHVTADKLITDLRQLATAKSKSFPDDLSRTKVAEILKGVHWEDRDQAANKGTQVHDLAEQLGRGQALRQEVQPLGHPVNAGDHGGHEQQQREIAFEHAHIPGAHIAGKGGQHKRCEGGHHSSTCRMARKASWGTSTEPICFMRFLPAFCFSKSLRLRVMSPP